MFINRECHTSNNLAICFLLWVMDVLLKENPVLLYAGTTGWNQLKYIPAVVSEAEIYGSSRWHGCSLLQVTCTLEHSNRLTHETNLLQRLQVILGFIFTFVSVYTAFKHFAYMSIGLCVQLRASVYAIDTLVHMGPWIWKYTVFFHINHIPRNKSVHDIL